MASVLGKLRILTALFLSVIFIGCGSSSSDDTPDSSGIPDNGNVAERESSSITSSITGIHYPINIYLPPDYSNSNDLYPVVYVTDAEWFFDPFSAVLNQNMYDVIMVGVGNSDGEGMGRRLIDYTLPGSQEYYQFLITELLPYIESEYRIDSNDRTIFGHSVGGLFVANLVFIEDSVSPYFKNYISSDGSFFLHPADSESLVQQRFANSSDLNVNLYLAGATRGNNQGVINFENLVVEQEFSGLNINLVTYEMGHLGVEIPAFTDAMGLIIE